MSGRREALIQHLAATIRCAVCAQGYDPQDMAILGRQARVWVVGISCSHCGTQALVFAMVKPGAPIQAGELTPEEAAAFQRWGPIQAREVEEMREFLRDFRGDMHDLLGED